MRAERYKERAHKADTEEFVYRRVGLLIKRAAAVTVMIAVGAFIYSSDFEFGKNCIDALGRAVKYEFSWAEVWADISGFAAGIWRFWVEIF
ncbi:MAG TPA: hypothetical protein H9900_06580 [Candidatus Monoglobus merdigallinarum]|uniref:Uncharacterized protein n=1 Tax=Candidatus Monoglobus merdigallinarum TaxID=2838698 RepID=A0A9D1PR94_9FIRM|nr:hypothetical protein [Candidatus Monoglobus merdigallinarum]